MKITFTESGFADYLYWQKQDRKTLKRINDILADIQRAPFNGIGKPEPLRGNLSGYWSRRIDEKHRVVYSVEDSGIVIYQCAGHYDE